MSWQLYLCMLPTLVYLFIFHYMPMYGVQIAFRDFMPGLGITGSPWVGLLYFKRFITLPRFWELIANTLALSLQGLLIGFPIPIIFALMLNEVTNIKFKKTIQNLTYIPNFLSIVIVVSMLMLFTSPTIGIFNTVRGLFGAEPVNFMGIPSMFRPLYIWSGIWQGMGFNAIIYIAALSNVDQELLEAATIDGANRLRKIWHINLPTIRPTIVILLIFSMGGIMGVGFEKVYLMQNTLNMEVSEVIATYVYKMGLQGGKYSYAAAIGLFNQVIGIIMLLITNRIAKVISGIAIL